MTEHSNDRPPPAVLPASTSEDTLPLPLAKLADVPEEEIRLAKQKSKRTRRAYKLDVRHFMRALHITSYEELRRVDHKAVIAWERIMHEDEDDAHSTVRRRLSALSSLFKHLVRYGFAENPVTEVERPAINRRHGTTLAFSRLDAAKLLNAPAEDTIEGLRDRAILSVGLQAGLRRAEIAALAVEDLAGLIRSGWSPKAAGGAPRPSPQYRPAHPRLYCCGRPFRRSRRAVVPPT